MKTARGFRGRYFSLASILALSCTVSLNAQSQTFEMKNSEVQKSQKEVSEEEEEVLPVEEVTLVVSKKIKVSELDAPFAAEIYTQKDIKRSNSKDIYEFLNTQTSISTIPLSGNNFTQKIDMRGYGVGDGYQNIVVTVDGKRLNNIDMVPQLLSAIPLESIEKIEVIKGSGSVEYGDGANAGAINIITKDHDGVSAKTYAGNYGLIYGSLALGIKKDMFSISGHVDDYSHDGFKDIDNSSNQDESWSRNKSIKATLTPIKDLTFNVGKTFSKMNIDYANALTLTEYHDDPDTIPAPKNYNNQYTEDNVLSYGVKYKMADKVSLGIQAFNEDKVVKYDSVGTAYESQSDYDYDNYNAKIGYAENGLKTLVGFQKSKGSRFSHRNIYSAPNKMEKDSISCYAKADYTISKNTFSFGARKEKVEYEYNAGANHLTDDASLSAFDLGYSYKIDKVSSVFINLNKSFQAPDIDRFFTYNFATSSYKFNGFIEPMKAKTVNIGYNHLSYPNRLKFSAFYSKLDNEIYYNANIASGTNTNLEETEKLGFEIYDKYSLLYNLFVAVNYSFVDTKIVKDGSGDLLNGRDIPGVAKHSLKASIGYNPTYRINLLLSHVFKSKAYAIDDFDGSCGKMENYNSTDFSATYKYKKFEFFTKAKNIFGEKNALFADSGTSLGVYPVNYKRTFMVGISAKF